MGWKDREVRRWDGSNIFVNCELYFSLKSENKWTKAHGETAKSTRQLEPKIYSTIIKAPKQNIEKETMNI